MTCVCRLSTATEELFIGAASYIYTCGDAISLFIHSLCRGHTVLTRLPGMTLVSQRLQDPTPMIAIRLCVRHTMIDLKPALIKRAIIRCQLVEMTLIEGVIAFEPLLTSYVDSLVCSDPCTTWLMFE